MPASGDYVLLGEYVREARSWWGDHHANNGEAFGRAIELAEEMLRPWLAAQVHERLGRGGGTQTRVSPDVIDDLLSEVSAAAVKGFANFEGTTGKEFYRWLQKIASCRLADLERARHARRRRGLDEAASLERDGKAAKLAELLEDEGPTPEAAALLKELKSEIRRAMKDLTKSQRAVVTGVMNGLTMSELVAAYGPTARADWRTAAAHIRRVLEGRSPRRKRKPK
jgi:DNA-directed RNA polymerase specialized sigma24 family protein